MSNLHDNIGDRMKTYENVTRFYVPHRTHTILRLDGCHFHTYTKGLNKPFDKQLMDDLNTTTLKVLGMFQGAKLAYVQSDECSILLTDYDTINTSTWFDGNVQKIASVASSMFSSEFNKLRYQRIIETQSMNLLGSVCKTAYFDCRVFTIPERTEVMNYFIWRNLDCIRNSISSVAQSLFSHKELDGKKSNDKLKMIESKGVSWENTYTNQERCGRIFYKELQISHATLNDSSLLLSPGFERSVWKCKDAWRFVDHKEELLNLIPNYT